MTQEEMSRKLEELVNSHNLLVWATNGLLTQVNELALRVQQLEAERDERAQVQDL